VLDSGIGSTSSSPADPTSTSALPVRVRDVMTPLPVTVESNATVKQVAHLILERGIGCVPVVERGDVLVGVVAEGDLISREGFPTGRSRHLADLIDEARSGRLHHWAVRAGGLTAGEVMSTEVVTCGPDEPIPVVTRRMLRADVRALPVVENGHLAGIVSRHDVLRLYDRSDEDVRRHVENLISDPLWFPEDQRIDVSVADGVVVLTGSVRYERDVAVAAAIVRQIPGVVEVDNRLVGREPDPTPVYLHDTDWR
jgi:CBS domain-containing protein